ncbi:adenosine kinase-like [Aphis craccivora]|uniref:Adenosine kinase n=1 Tax=Aphis craccivora TaxID=307492 RepID=A0A6G0YD43_APHCR|nr:adenosine kinase-like [Aphis craccivora]
MDLWKIQYHQKPQKTIDDHSRIVKPGTVVGFCNPLLDMTVVGNADLLKRYDLKNNYAILAGKKQTGIEELKKDPNVHCTAGGSSQNSWTVVQYKLKKQNSAAFFGAVGKDRYSEILDREVISDGLNMKSQYHSDKAAGEQ